MRGSGGWERWKTGYSLLWHEPQRWWAWIVESRVMAVAVAMVAG